MSMYTLWCLIEGDKNPFSVTALSTIFISVLKQEIKKDKGNLLRKVDANDLILWKVDVDPDTVRDKIRIGQYKPDVTDQQPLWDAEKLSTIWSEPPPDKFLHVFVNLPIKLSPIVQQTGDASTRDLWPMFTLRDLWSMVTLRTTSQREFERLETIGKNKISELHDTEPDFLFDFRTKLAQCRWIESGTEDPVVLHLKHKLHGFDNYFQPAPIDVEQRDRVSSELELSHLTFALTAVAWKEGDIKEANVRWIFDTLGWHFHSILSPRESYAFCGDWPFKIVVLVESEKKQYRYTPRSDFSLSVNGLMYLLVEVQSDKHQYDRHRMLLQAACVARLGRLLYDNPFIVMALYIENSGRVTRYFVFQHDGTDPKVSYVEESQNWKEPFQLFKAIFEIYNLVSIMQSDRSEGGGIEEHIRTLAFDIENNFSDGIPYYICGARIQQGNR